MTDNGSSLSFGDLGLSEDLIESLDRNGIREPLEVQRRAIPLVLDGRDLLVQSRTGTGKTLAFVLPLLQRVDPEYGFPQALVVAPTRELANQVGAVFARIGRSLGIRTATLTGGVPYGEQLQALRHGVHVVIGTPGRLCDHIDRRTLSLKSCEFVALDEADEILDMGFQEDLEKILESLPAKRQTLLFSATLADEIERLAHRYMRQPERLSLSSGLKAAATLRHVVCEVNRAAKYESLVNLLHVEQPELALVFCHTKLDTEDLARRLLAEGFKVGCLNGNLAQAVRSSTLESFRQHEITVLVATDVAARGIDVRGITHVFNYDIPANVENYIHRGGRAGRAGHEGRVLNLVAPADRRKIQTIVSAAQIRIENRLVPRGNEVRKTLRDKFFETLANRIEAGALDDFREFAAELLENLDAAALVSALLQDVQAGTGHLAAGYDIEPPGRSVRKQAERDAKRPPEPTASPSRERNRSRTERAVEDGMVRLRVSVGKGERLLPGHLVRVICSKAQIAGSAIGAISLLPHHALVDVQQDVARKVVAALDCSRDEQGRSWSVTVSPS